MVQQEPSMPQETTQNVMEPEPAQPQEQAQEMPQEEPTMAPLYENQPRDPLQIFTDFIGHIKDSRVAMVKRYMGIFPLIMRSLTHF